MIQIPDTILNELKKVKGVEAILFTGSRVLGKEAKNSDWDFHVLLAEGKPRWRKTKKIGNTWIELFCNDRRQIEKYFEENMKEAGRGVDLFMFATGIVIQDNANNDLKKLVAEAKKLWRRGPKKLSKEGLSFINYDISGYIQDVEDCIESNNRALLIFDYAVNEMVCYAFKLRGSWIPRPKERLDELKNIDPAFFNLVDAYFAEPNWRAKGELIYKMGKELGKKFGMPLDGELYLAPKRTS